MLLRDLDAASRKSGLRVVECAGWAGRTRPGGMSGGAPCGILIHHTATSARATGNYPTLRIVRDGRGKPGTVDYLGGPLAQLGLGRDGTVYVIAAGRANHAGRTDRAASGNALAIGIEAEHPGVGPWPQVQYQAYVALVAALCEHYDIPTAQVRGHKEAAVDSRGRKGRKTDPNFDMDQFRRDVAAARKAGPATTVDVPPRDPRYGHRGTPNRLIEDGLWGGKTADALLWHVDGDRLVGLTRDNVRDVQTWAGRPRTGRLDRDDIEAIQAKTGSTPDGIWPRKPGQKSRTTLGIQRFLNRRIDEARKA